MAEASGLAPRAALSHLVEVASPAPLICNRCGFEVRSLPWGCKNPCTNGGTVYPLGDCSD